MDVFAELGEEKKIWGKKYKNEKVLAFYVQFFHFLLKIYTPASF